MAPARRKRGGAGMRTVRRLLYRDILSSFTLVMAGFLALFFFLDFIDDLDRCLPEKALEMLEAIKLFFDVPRCVFVLAVDDEVVERGVQHRYRDYLFEASKAASADASHRLPITGAEYLEKIIHLPLRLPPAQTGQAEQFLRERYPELFDYQATHREYLALAPKALEEEHEAARQRLARRQAKVKDGHDEPERDEAETTTLRQAKQLLRQAQQQRDLCQLFARAVPVARLKAAAFGHGHGLFI